MKFQIKHRVTGEIQFEYELSAELETASYSLQLGFAVKAAVKARAYLAGADLVGANLVGAENAPDMPQTEETDEQREARYAARAAKFRERFPEVPVVKALDAKILSAINVEGCTLDMSSWHKCETTHCRAGWAVTLAGKEGLDLEAKYGPEDAGRRIYLASTGYVPNFFDSNDAALKDIKARAETQLRAE